MGWDKKNQAYQQIKKLKIKRIGLFSKLQNKTVGVGFLFAIMAAAFSALPNVIPKSLMEEQSADAAIVPNPMMLVFVIYIVNSLLFSPFRKSDRKPVNEKKGRTTLLL
ncbi:MAG: hypothetical protein HKM23_04055, partial [Nitrosopumilus sp.]|nr:hypothetical protein [Nitrosopumilus sp.]